MWQKESFYPATIDRELGFSESFGFNVAAFNWGFMSGKTNTIYAWNMPRPGVEEPKVWFHDIFRNGGTVKSDEEVVLI